MRIIFYQHKKRLKLSYLYLKSTLENSLKDARNFLKHLTFVPMQKRTNY